jgi:hypothetical protein
MQNAAGQKLAAFLYNTKNSRPRKESGCGYAVID